MTLDDWVQLGILSTGCIAVMLLGIPDSWTRWKPWKRFAPVLGLLSQPLWFIYAGRHSGTWGISVVNVAYTLSWATNCWLTWIAPRMAKKEKNTSS